MEDYHRYNYFYTLDYKGDPSTVGYTLPITPFTFIPIFDDGVSTDYSSKHILWDFGDGTTSESITATHYYKLPGWYTVKCYILFKEGEGYTDSFSQNLVVHDFISDSLSISGYNVKMEAGILENPYTVYRFNSWQTYPLLSAAGYTLNLNAEGFNAPLLKVDDYNKDKWGHLKPSSRFESFEYNPYKGNYERIPVNTILTEENSNSEIYVRLFNNKLTLCKKEDSGSCFAGTSGKKLFYFIDDLPKYNDGVFKQQAVTIFVSFDTKKFYDLDSYGKNYKNEISVLNTIFDTTGYSVVIPQLRANHMTITSNGIDDDRNGTLIDNFYIYEQKFTGQKIPFVVKIKNDKEFPAKFNPVLTYNSSPDIFTGDIYLELRDSDDNPIPNVTFYNNFGILSTETYGGYFKGYLICDTPVDNVHIFGVAGVTTDTFSLVDTTYTIISEPQSDKIHSITLKQDVINKNNKTLTDSLMTIDGLRGIYSSCVVSKRSFIGKTSFVVWVVDADREKIVKYDPVKSEILYDNFILPDNSSPSDICSDKDGNVWVTLYDSVSTVRINNLSNLVDKVICPSKANRVIVDYENSVTPASIDTDLNNNVWISYSNQLSSFIEKYDNDGLFLFNKSILQNYQCTDIVTDLNANVWGIAKDLATNTNILSAKNDKIFKIDKNGSSVNYYSVNGSLWNLTLDISGNIWATKNKSEVAVVDTHTNTISTFNLDPNPYPIQNYTSDLEGIACTTDNSIIIVDNSNRRLHYFNADVKTYGFLPSYIGLIDQNIPFEGRVEDKLNAYGDWNGFKYINKFQNTFGKLFPVVGNSNTFNIYPSDQGEYEIRKVNENFDIKNQMMSYRFQDYLQNSPLIFEKFMGASLGTLSSKPNEISKVAYEKISNFIDNINNIDSCNIKALESMYEMMDEDYYTFNNRTYNIPSELNRLIDIFSVKFSKLKGSKNKFNLDFDNKGYDNDILRENKQPINYGINKGKKLDFFTSVLTAGHSIIAYENFSQNYRVINTNISNSYLNDVNFINISNKTYALSTYSQTWGWGLSLPDNYLPDQIPLFYTFYDYVTGSLDIQNEGVINWQDDYNTISYNISSTSEWSNIKEKMVYFSLAKGLGIIK